MGLHPNPDLTKDPYWNRFFMTAY